MYIMVTIANITMLYTWNLLRGQILSVHSTKSTVKNVYGDYMLIKIGCVEKFIMLCLCISNHHSLVWWWFQSLFLVAQFFQTLYNPTDYSLPGSSVHGDSPGKNTAMGCHALLQGNLPDPGMELRSPALQADSLPSELRGKPKRGREGEIFLTQGWNLGVLHC